jgi:MFS family permease
VLPKRRGLDHEEAEKKAQARREFKEMDWIGSWSLSIAVTALMLGLSIGPSTGWTSVWCLGTFVLAVVMTAAFVHRIRTAEHPLIPAEYFHRRNFVMPMVLRGAANFAYFGAFFLFPLLMEQGYHYSIPHVGALAIARPITFSLCSPIAGYVAVRIGERVSAIAGATFLTASLGLFAFLQPSSGTWVVAIALALSGLGMGVAMPSSSSVMANEVKTNEFGVMSAAQMLAMQVGEVAGIQVLETVQQALVRRRGLLHAKPGPALLATFHLPFMIGAGVGAIGLFASLFIRSIPRSRKEKALASDR